MAQESLKRSLTSRQMQMIALGGTIGVGLFMGSASTIKWTGPSVLLAYGLAGLILYMVMRALGEMLYVDPSTGSFAKYATEYIHPVVGYLTAWSNVFQYLVVGISEVIAVGTYLAFWWPNLPQWIAGIVVVVTLCIANLTSVKAYGELEFWFALIKVVTIILMIVLGLLVIVFGVGNHGHPVGISNLWVNGGFFTGGIKGFIFALSIVVASYQGIEVIGITAGEAENPQQNIVKAIRSIVGRILIFYIGAIFVIVSIYPWDKLGTIGSPFVETFAKVGITTAAMIINFVMLTAAMSGCNSGIFSSSRMLYTLGIEHHLPKVFTKVSKHQVPYVPVITISAGILIGLILNYSLPALLHTSSNIFVIVYSSSVLPGMVPWFVILISQLRFRKMNQNKMADHPFKMPWYPISNYLSIAALLVILVFMFLNPETTVSLMVGVVFLIVMTAIYFIRDRRLNGATANQARQAVADSEDETEVDE
ncbi:amino acid permease [Companilactobacillus sp.]|uniref:amino acid permease n=1 Tax=Companilactobacillus sp. TaxID=2767905 RepID=UPI0025BDA17C|nr:amino acid permease [Companilactobacillus sp.]MCH4009270.1 amino acid permease [Companilactobacillus sp.]MCH4050551.1 amino acid permease [Companilactobacillus sp.]MCH4077212.1 amino acid permease [Companilactobacillus sp.]MCH4125788.1 amino acid permease [Companilactobacillus sp.]MCI1311497.1 amino acid permease [Companilactobacillus sp.]